MHEITSLFGGSAIIQTAVPIDTDDNLDTLAKRVLQTKHQIYPQAIRWTPPPCLHPMMIDNPHLAH